MDILSFRIYFENSKLNEILKQVQNDVIVIASESVAIQPFVYYNISWILSGKSRQNDGIMTCKYYVKPK